MAEASVASPPPGAQAGTYEAQHVHAVYSAIAPHFAATRYAPWPAVDAFLASLPHHALVADLGCGNGKYLLVAQRLPNEPFAVGTDRCAPLVDIAAKQREDGTIGSSRFDAGVADVRELPFRDCVFDAAVNIAVVHHLATEERRVSAWRETMRILRPGGRLLAYVWALERPSTPKPKRGNHGAKMLSRRFEGQDVFVPWQMRRRKAGANSDKILGEPEETHKRFYHVYRKGELERELEQVPHAKVVRSYYDHQNWCAEVERV